ncbi:GntR family transcriptional regulator [Dactylosporangium aurantiacum]|uniref:GntR family transcriptional regulator n=1 Tax=Dactylosporangium aurantiacum TaxID=35754 RepID=A0A9Q9MEN0_9ACTN|nr:GntR family transcriptional regulator [Dactylosporangium aurantiacum]
MSRVNVQRHVPAVYHQIADFLRAEIVRGTYPAGQPMPSERELCERYTVSLTTVRRAVNILREEGLVTSRRGAPSTVRERPIRSTVVMGRGSKLTCRMPTTTERFAMNIERGVPLVEVRDKSGRVEVFLADRVEILNPEGLAGAATRIMDVA